jgi:hypothetical protein
MTRITKKQIDDSIKRRPKFIKEDLEYCSKFVQEVFEKLNHDKSSINSYHNVLNFLSQSFLLLFVDLLIKEYKSRGCDDKNIEIYIQCHLDGMDCVRKGNGWASSYCVNNALNSAEGKFND